jgi:hypothetical protein
MRGAHKCRRVDEAFEQLAAGFGSLLAVVVDEMDELGIARLDRRLDHVPTARDVLRNTFGHVDFRGLQAGVIGEILAGHSALAANGLPAQTS